MNELLFARLCKIKALADGGVGGEATNARAMFDSLLSSSGFTEADFNHFGAKEVSFEVEITDKDQFWRLFTQIAASLELKVYAFSESGLKSALRSCPAHIRKEVKKIYGAKRNFTELQGSAAKIEDFKLQWEVYRAALKDEFEATYIAFIHANRIFPPKKDDETNERKPLTAIQKKALVRAMEMEAIEVRKRLN